MSAMTVTEATAEHGEPVEGMCCLCTMEDITNEEKNYGNHLVAKYYL